MRIFRSLEEVPVNFGTTVVSVGNFDGVHCGHQHVLKEVVRRARESGSQAVAVTFEPHPLRVLRPDVTLKLITPQLRKEALLAASGLDALLVIPFTHDFSLTAPAEFPPITLPATLPPPKFPEDNPFPFAPNPRGP